MSATDDPADRKALETNGLTLVAGYRQCRQSAITSEGVCISILLLLLASATMKTKSRNSSQASPLPIVLHLKTFGFFE